MNLRPALQTEMRGKSPSLRRIRPAEPSLGCTASSNSFFGMLGQVPTGKASLASPTVSDLKHIDATMQAAAPIFDKACEILGFIDEIPGDSSAKPATGRQRQGFENARKDAPDTSHTAIHGQKPMIRDGHAVGIAGQILQHVLWPAKGSLGINHPVFLKQSAQEGCEGLLVRQRLTRTKEDKLVALESPP